MKIGTVLRKWRIVEERTVRDVAREIGIDRQTLLNVENGDGCNANTLAQIFCWLTDRNCKKGVR